MDGKCYNAGTLLIIALISSVSVSFVESSTVKLSKKKNSNEKLFKRYEILGSFKDFLETIRYDGMNSEYLHCLMVSMVIPRKIKILVH